MPLLTDFIGFLQPALEFGIDIADRLQAEMVNVVSGGDRFDLAETRVLPLSCQDDVTVEPIHARGDLCKRHSRLECNARFFGKHDHRTKTLEHIDDRVKKNADFGRFTLEMRFEIVTAAEVRLIPIGESALASRALPERSIGSAGHEKYSEVHYR